MLFARSVAGLARQLASLPSLVVALSGGVDSAALAGIARRSVRGRLLAVTTRSAAVPAEEVAVARSVARRLGIDHRVLDTRELEDASYRANRGDRCYFCRVEMYGALRGLADREGIAHLADGLQADDLVADRPGVRAAAERGVLHPLRDAGLGKAGVRRLARALGLGVHDKPAQPCLASRLPVGTEVTAERLRLVHRAETAVRALGYRELRVRCEGAHGKIEIGAAELARARAAADRLEAAVVGAGFASAALDPNAYGSLQPEA